MTGKRGFSTPAVTVGVLTALTLSAAPMTPVAAQEAPATAGLVACRQLTDGAARLACYDREVEKLETARQTGEVVIVERAEVNRTRRALFGFSLPSLPVLEGPGASAPIDAIEARLTALRSTGRDQWVFTLDDGSVWAQTDTSRSIDARPGDPVVVRRAALGSFMLRVDGGRSIRVRRQN